MTTAPMTVVIPLGPLEAHQRWIEECLDSVAAQTTHPYEILIVDDVAPIPSEYLPRRESLLRYWRAPWHIGVASAFNCGVALASRSWILMLGADDTLEPTAIEAWWESAHQIPEQEAERTDWDYGVRYMESGETQTVPCNAAVVHKHLWDRTGGFPVETASGAPDSALISILMTHPDVGALRPIANGAPLYNYRSHPDTDTAQRGPWQSVILETRNILTRDWKPPRWGRYS